MALAHPAWADHVVCRLQGSDTTRIQGCAYIEYPMAPPETQSTDTDMIPPYSP